MESNVRQDIRRALDAGTLVTALALALVMQQSAYASTVFSDTFEDGDTAGGPVHRHLVGGDRRLKVLQQSSHDPQRAPASSPGRRPGPTTACRPGSSQWRWDATGFAGIVARASGTTMFYRLALLPSNQVQLQVVLRGTTTVLAIGREGRDHRHLVHPRVRPVRLVDPRLRRRRALDAATDTGITAGRIGVQTTRSAAEFDDVLVTHGPDTPPTTPAPVPTTPVPTTTPQATIPPTILQPTTPPRTTPPNDPAGHDSAGRDHAAPWPPTGPGTSGPCRPR